VPDHAPDADPALRRTILTVAGLNLAYFGVEFAGALVTGSTALFADSVDFLEDGSVNLLILLAMGWTAVARARVGMALAALMAVPALAFLAMLVAKLISGVPPEGGGMTLLGLGALAANLTCALLLARHRHGRGTLTKAAFLSARNDAVANVALIGAGLVTLAWASIWPDLIVGLGIAWMNLDAASDIWRAARAERAGAAEA
jgi:Co/Zn/Cd efflux system component